MGSRASKSQAVALVYCIMVDWVIPGIRINLSHKIINSYRLDSKIVKRPQSKKQGIEIVDLLKIGLIII